MLNLSGITSLNVFFLWTTIVATGLFLYTFVSLKHKNKKIKEIKNQEEKRWRELESKAQKDYQEVLETANKKAQDIILQANHIRDESTADFQKAVDAMLSNQKEVLELTSLSIARKYEEEINRINKENIQTLQNIYKDIETSTKSDFTKYKEFIQQQTFDAEKIAKERIEEEYKKLENEINLRKEKELKKLNDDIYTILLNISKEVVGKSMNFSDHQDLIIDALERAKKEGIT